MKAMESPHLMPQNSSSHGRLPSWISFPRVGSVGRKLTGPSTRATVWGCHGDLSQRMIQEQPLVVIRMEQLSNCHICGLVVISRTNPTGLRSFWVIKVSWVGSIQSCGWRCQWTSGRLHSEVRMPSTAVYVHLALPLWKKERLASRWNDLHLSSDELCW